MILPLNSVWDSLIGPVLRMQIICPGFPVTVIGRLWKMPFAEDMDVLPLRMSVIRDGKSIRPALMKLSWMFRGAISVP